jgi:hypothetical protein
VSSPALTAAKRLTRTAEKLAGEEDADYRRLAERLRVYFGAASRGLSLDAAFELTLAPGQSPWWTERQHEIRDQALRGLRARHYAALRTSPTAREIAALSRSYAADVWPDAQHDVQIIASQADPECKLDHANDFLWRAFKSGAPMPLGHRQLTTVLSWTPPKGAFVAPW